MKVGYRIRNKRDEELFRIKFNYSMGVHWDYEKEKPVYMVNRGMFNGWRSLSECRNIPVYDILDFKRYYETINNTTNISPHPN